MQQYFKKVIVALLIILTIPLFFSLIRPGFFPMQDDLQAFRIQQMVKCFKDFQIPCRWIPDMGYQYGYPQFNFYPPGIYYIGALFNLAGIQVIDAVKILFILGFIFSALTMYFFLKSLLGKWPAFVGAMLYSVVPYKATEVYVRGSLSEFWAFVFFPLIFWTSLQLVRFNKIKYVVYLAISIGLLLITHNLMSFIFLPIFGIWVITIILIWKKRRALLKVAVSCLLGLGLAAFFSLPVIFESKYVHLETLVGGYFDWRQHFVDLKQLFLSNYFGYGSSMLGPNDDLSLSVGIVHWILGLTAVILAIFTFKKEKRIGTIVLVMAAVELLVLFLMHQKSTFLWEMIPGLSWLQFPWRFLSDSTFILSFLGAITVYIIGNFNKKTGVVLGVLVIVILFVLHASFFKPYKWFNISDTDKFSGFSWEKQLTISIFDYLPIYAEFPPTQKAPILPEVLEGEVIFTSYKKGSNYQSGQINVKQNALVRLPLFDFPGMEVLVDGKKIEHTNSDCRKEQFCLGLVTVKVLSGDHSIRVQLADTPVRRIGNTITILSILVVFVLLSKKDENFV